MGRFDVPYLLNISHPDVTTAFDGYYLKNKIPRHFPLSDRQRLEFEINFMKEKLETGIDDQQPTGYFRTISNMYIAMLAIYRKNHLKCSPWYSFTFAEMRAFEVWLMNKTVNSPNLKITSA